MNLLNKSIATLALGSVLAGCAAPGYYGDNQAPYYNRAITGAAVGAAGGALLGYAADGGYGNGAWVGGALGALAGGAAGYYLDQQRNAPVYRPYPPYRGPRSHRGNPYPDGRSGWY